MENRLFPLVGEMEICRMSNLVIYVGAYINRESRDQGQVSAACALVFSISPSPYGSA